MCNENKPLFILLGIILFFGFLLRFWDLFSIPFIHAELSALYRLRFDSFNELVKNGITPDGHPAGVQVFLYYWTMVFGSGEIAVKLPFLLAGLASVYLSYRIGEIWFGKTSGILTATYISSLQLFVMYSQIARPYISGLFFALFAVFYWSKYFFKSSRLKYLFGFVLFSALAAYNHHFSLLFMVIVGLSGLWFTNRKTLIPFIISGVLILVLYVPHLPIFFSQVNQGVVSGIGGWLDKPNPWFLFQFTDWLFHYSFWVYGLLLAVVLYLGLSEGKTIRSDNALKKRIVLLVWFLFPVVVGFVYSVVINPILQYSLLIFSTPFLFVFLFSFVKEIKVRQLFVWVALILLINIVTLILKRDYYKIFYKQQFEQVVKKAINLEKQNPGNVFIINDYIPFYSTYYFRKYGKELPYFTIRNKDITIAEFKKVLSEIDQNIVITSGLTGMYFQLIKEQFPYWIGYDCGFTFEQYVFSKTAHKDYEYPERKMIAQFSFSEKDTRWQYLFKNVHFDSLSDQLVYKVCDNKEYDLDFMIPLNEPVDDVYWIIDYEIEYKTNDSCINAVIVCEIKMGKELVSWQGSKISDFEGLPGKWQKAFLTLDLQTAMNNQNKIEDQLLKFYIWNKGHNQFLIKDIRVFLRPGNPNRYSLLMN